MPRNGSNVYSAPAGTTATAGTTIESAKYNAFVNDLVADANLARPIVAGGTGATTAAAALTNLGLTATAAEINVLDGVTASTAELNILDGVTASTTELNYVDGVTSAIQTQIDGKQAADADLTAIAALTGTGLLARTGAGTYAARTITSTDASVTITNPGGVAGNIDLSVPAPPASGGLTLLGSASMSGLGTVTVSGLTLTSYKFLIVSVDAQFNGASTVYFTSATTSRTICSGTVNADRLRGSTMIDLTSGTFSGGLGLVGNTGSSPTGSVNHGGLTGLSTASTAVSIVLSSNTFSSGTMYVYGQS